MRSFGGRSRVDHALKTNEARAEVLHPEPETLTERPCDTRALCDGQRVSGATVCIAALSHLVDGK
jgi:hypothetical protein